ncbi:hypothetical protein KI387_042490, partial [Taxus chinensis]
SHATLTIFLLSFLRFSVPKSSWHYCLGSTPSISVDTDRKPVDSDLYQSTAERSSRRPESTYRRRSSCIQ